MEIEKKTIWKQIKKTLSVVEPGTTPPNWKYIGLSFISLFGSAYSLCFLFPFLPEMVLSFGYVEEEKGYYVGLIASSVFAGRVLGSYFWGYLSDIKGRRLVLLICILGNGIFCLAFGFSTNLAMAIVFRLGSGAFNGIVGTAKAILYEISDDTNQAIGMSTISLAWGFGLIVGPTLSGWLTSPCTKYPHIFGNNWFLETYQYFLPSLVCFIVCMMSLVIIFFKFEETLHNKDININIIVDDTEDNEEKSFISGENIHKLKSIESLKSSIYQTISVEDLHNESEAATFLVLKNLKNEEIIRSNESLNKHVRTPLPDKDISLSNDNVSLSFIGEQETNGNVDNKIIASDTNSKGGNLVPVKTSPVKNSTDDDSIQVNTSPVKCIMKDDSCSIKEKSLTSSCMNSKLIQLFKEVNIRNTILLYTVFSFGVIGFEDVFTTWASTAPRLDGLGFDPSEIGTCLGAVAIPLLLLQMKFYPMIVNKLGIQTSFAVFSIVIMVSVQTIPVLHLLYAKKTILWVLLILILLCQKLGATCCFSGSSLLINNSCLPNMIGTVNGIAMMFTAFARTLAPTAGGSLFAWSVSYGSQYIGPPCDVSITFVALGVVLFASCIMCTLLPKSLNKQRKLEPTDI